jgi:colanic acid/amylovoran biosynthesis glycosyltransferase
MSSTNRRLVFVSGGIGLGGATTFLLNLTGELVRRAVPVLVVSLEHENPYAEDFSRLGIPLHVEDERRHIFEDRLSSALQVIRRFEPTAVISCLGPSSFEILRYVPKGATRFGMIQSDFPENYPPFEPYVPFLDGIVGVSKQIEANLRVHPILGRVPSYCLHYGVQLPQLQSQSMRNRHDPIRILYLGRVCRPQKRVHLFPQILYQLRASGVPFQWTIAGDGPERRWLEAEMTSTSSSSAVHFLGAISYRDVPALLDRHDILLLASDAEGLPVSLLEAMAHGLVPVVSNLASGVSEVVGQDCGMLVDPNDVDGYGRAIVQLHRRRDELEAKAIVARERVRAKFSVDVMTDRWLSVLNGSQKLIEWPREFRIRGPLTDVQQWKYTAAVRPLRRFLKRVGIRSGGAVSTGAQ